VGEEVVLVLPAAGRGVADLHGLVGQQHRAGRCARGLRREGDVGRLALVEAVVLEPEDAAVDVRFVGLVRVVGTVPLDLDRPVVARRVARRGLRRAGGPARRPDRHRRYQQHENAQHLDDDAPRGIALDGTHGVSPLPPPVHPPDGPGTVLSRRRPSETWKFRRLRSTAMPAPTLQPGLRHRFTYRVPPNKTVPNLYSEAED